MLPAWREMLRPDFAPPGRDVSGEPAGQTGREENSGVPDREVRRLQLATAELEGRGSGQSRQEPDRQPCGRAYKEYAATREPEHEGRRGNRDHQACRPAANAAAEERLF